MEPSRLARRLGTADAVFIGLGSMLGAGVFVAIAPAARAAGDGLLLGLGVAAVLSFCNATSSAQLAALYPASGGTYVYGRERLGAFWGYLAGWGFVAGKTASCAAIALTFGSYVHAGAAPPLAAGAVAVLTFVNTRGVTRTARATRVIVAFVIAVLALVVAVCVSGAGFRTPAVAATTPAGVLQAAGLLFFAFAGYARIATLGEEVRDPKRTIPRAIPLALVVALTIYAAVAASALAAVGADAIAGSDAPLVTAVRGAGRAWSAPVVRAGAAAATLGVLLSLLAGVARTAFAMAGRGELPRSLDAVHPRTRVPHRAEWAAGATVAVVVLLVDLRGAIGFSSFAVLVYYAITNASALTLRRTERRWPRPIAALGLAGCILVAFSLPPSSVVGGGALFALGAALRIPPGLRGRPG